MEFLIANLINTTTQLALSNNTALASSVFNRDPQYQYYTDGMNNDATTASMTITFDVTTAVSRIALLDTNLKGFTAFYNGATANTFSLSDQHTTTSNFSANTDENVYLRFATTMVSSITLDMKTTQTANLEKILGLLYLGDLQYSMTVLPNSGGYKPSLVPKQVVHAMSDGGTRIHTVRNKFNINIDLDYLQSADVSGLRTVFDQRAPFNFALFATSTGWTNPVFFEAVWPGKFGFYEYSADAAASGFSGRVALMETAF